MSTDRAIVAGMTGEDMQPKFPEGTPEYERYAADLRQALAEWSGARYATETIFPGLVMIKDQWAQTWVEVIEGDDAAFRAHVRASKLNERSHRLHGDRRYAAKDQRHEFVPGGKAGNGGECVFAIHDSRDQFMQCRLPRLDVMHCVNRAEYGDTVQLRNKPPQARYRVARVAYSLAACTEHMAFLVPEDPASGWMPGWCLMDGLIVAVSYRDLVERMRKALPAED